MGLMKPLPAPHVRDETESERMDRQDVQRLRGGSTEARGEVEALAGPQEAA